MGRIGIASRIFNEVSKLNVSIPFITQTSPETSICFGIDNKSAIDVIKSIEDNFKKEIECEYIQNILEYKNVSLITIIGLNMIKTPGIAGKIFTLLGKNDINIVAISQGSSEISITLVIDMEDELDALNILHNALID